MLLMIDNYDCFTYNLVQYLGELGADVLVQRNDAITLDAGRSAGARAHRDLARPLHAGRRPASRCRCIRRFAGQHPDPRRLPRPPGDRPGVRRARRPRGARDARQDSTRSRHDGRGVFTGIPSPFTVTRYHSLAIERATLPDCLEVTARHRTTARSWACAIASTPVEGVQFHPESILTEHGHAMLRNFLDGRR